MQAILDNAAEGIVLISKDHTVLLFNTAIKDALKSYFTKELEVGDDYRDFVVKESMQLYLESFKKAINGTSISVEHETKNTDVTIWFQYTVNPVYDRQKKLIGVTLTATNITDRKKLELEREEIINHLLQRNSDLLEFSQIVSHSVRAPLANLLGLINLIADDLPTAEQRFIFDGIRKSSERFDEVIKDLNGILQIRESISEKKIRVYFHRVLFNVKKNINNSRKSKVTIKSDFTSADNKIDSNCLLSGWLRHYYADSYQNDELIQGRLLGRCGKCEFTATPDQERSSLRRGYKECWQRTAGFDAADFDRPHVLDLWYFLKKDAFIANGRYFLVN